MIRFLYIIAIIFLIGWVIRISFPYLLKFFMWLLNRKMEKKYGPHTTEQTVEYKAKEKRNKNDDDEFIEYEEVK